MPFTLPLYVQPRTKKRITNMGMGTPSAQSRIHPTFPFSFCNSFISPLGVPVPVYECRNPTGLDSSFSETPSSSVEEIS